jgi:hypothetical protein
MGEVDEGRRQKARHVFACAGVCSGLSLCAVALSGCSVLDDDAAGASRPYYRVSCLDMARATEAEIRTELPGNASEIRFTHCEVVHNPFPVAHAIAHVRMRQNICKWGRCVAAWSYTTRVFGEAVFGLNCEMDSARIWAEPPVAVLNPLIKKAQEEIPSQWPAFRDKHNLSWICAN